MLQAQVIGLGAAGNKAAVELVNQKVVSGKNIILVNSAIADISAKSQEMFKVVKIGSSDINEGCGKMAKKGQEIALEALQNGTVNLESLIDPNADMVILVGSLEGGTGSGSLPVFASYLINAMDMKNIKIFGFVGFGKEARGLDNAVKWFDYIPQGCSIHLINNNAFMPAARNNHAIAEHNANLEFCTQVSILLGNCIVPSAQNIDKADLKTVSLYHGYSMVEYKEFDDHLTNTSQFSDIIFNMIASSKNLMAASKAASKNFAMIVNVPDGEAEYIDYSFSEMIKKFESPVNKFIHVQFDPSMRPFVAFIVSGMNMPIEAYNELKETYEEETRKINANSDPFFNRSGSKSNLNMFDFDSGSNNKVSEKAKKNFFDSFGAVAPNPPKDNKENY